MGHLTTGGLHGSHFRRKTSTVTRNRVFLFSWIAFTALAILFSVQRYYADSFNGSNANWFDAFIGAFIVWWSWGLLTPLIVRIGRAIPFTSESKTKIALLIPAGVSVAVLHALIVATITPQFYYRPSILPIRDMFRGRLASALAFDMIVYSLILAVYYIINYAAESRRREIASAQLAETLARTQLHALQAQLQPHFLFNTLNSILALVHENPDRAGEMIRRLSELLRYCLATSDVSEVPLADEVKFARAYVDIQKIRFEDRLEVEFAIDDRLLNTPVPSFLLQPIVENAVKFSFNGEDNIAQLRISAAQREQNLDLSVEDNGPGVSDETLDTTQGLGVRATRARLRQIYGDDHQIQFENLNPGMRVLISIPMKSSSRK